MIAPRVRRWAPAFLAAAVVRLLYWALVLPDWTPRADADQYVRLGRALARGDGFTSAFPQFEVHATAFRPPLYPFLLAPGSWLFEGALWPGRLLNVLLGSLVVVLAGVLAARIAGRAAGWATVAAVALYPPLVANDTVTLTEPLALALLLGAILLLDERRWALAGVATGLLLLARPNGYLVVAVLGAWCWHRLGSRRAVGLVLVALAVVAPWLVRNRVQVGTWRLTTSDGFTLAATYAAPARAADAFVDPVYSDQYQDPRHRLAQFDEAGWNRLLTDEAIDGLRDDPGYVARVVRRNAAGYFELTPERNRQPETLDGRHLGVVRATRPLFFAVTLAGLVGLARRRHDPRVRVLAVITAQFVVLSLVLVAPPRLRAPLDLACCVGVGLLAGEVATRSRGRIAGTASLS